MQSHGKSFAQIESNWTFREGVSSLISNISCTNQSNFLLHFLENSLSRSFVTVECLSLQRLPVEEDIFWVHPRAGVSASVCNLHNLHRTSHIEIGKLHTVGLQ